MIVRLIDRKKENPYAFRIFDYDGLGKMNALFAGKFDPAAGSEITERLAKRLSSSAPHFSPKINLRAARVYGKRPQCQRPSPGAIFSPVGRFGGGAGGVFRAVCPFIFVTTHARSNGCALVLSAEMSSENFGEAALDCPHLLRTIPVRERLS